MNPSLSIKKAFVYTVIVATLAWAGAAYMVNITQPARAAAPGDLIKMAGNPAVYYLGSDSKRYVFPNQKTFNTWYSDFSSVVTVSQSELESYAIGGNVTYRAGSRLAKITTDPKVYAVEPGGVLRWVSSEAIAADLFGSNWNKMIDDVPDPFFVNYASGSDITSSSYPSGSLVKMANDATIYYIDGSSKRAIGSEAAFNANRFNWSYVVNTSIDLASYSVGSAISGSEADLTTVAGPEVSTPVSSTGTLSVSLASDTPAAATVVENAARVGFTKVNLTASGGDVTIDSLTVQRTGISADSQFADVLLLDVTGGVSAGLASQIGNEKSLGSNHTAVFNDDITVSNGNTKSLLVAANMGATLNSGELAKLELVSMQLKGSATMSGSLPVAGNTMTMNGTLAIGSATIDNGSSNPSASTQKVGTSDYIVSSVKITAGAQEAMKVHKIRFYQNGTAADGDVANLELVSDGSVLAAKAAPVSKGVEFNLNPPLQIAKGNNKSFDLRLDIVGGSSRYISFDVEKKADVVVQGETYGYYRVPTYQNSGTTVSVSPYYNAPDTSIDVGSITFAKGVLTTLNVAEGASTQALGAFKATVQGEPVQITQFVIGATVSGTGNVQDISNLVVKNSSGSTVAGPVDPDTGSTSRDTATSTDTVIFPVGTNTYTIYGDLNSDFAANDTILLDLADPDGLFTAKGDVTNQTITPNPTSDLSLDTVTVKTGSLKVSIASTPSAQTIIIGQSDVVFSNFVLDASDAGENVRVTQFALAHKTSGATSREDHIGNLTLYDGATPLSPIVQPGNAAGSNSATSTFSLTNPIVVSKGTSKTITLKGDILNGSAGDTHKFGCNSASCVTATGASTGNTVSPNVTNGDGSAMTLATGGSVTVSDDASNPTTGLLVAGSSKQTLAELRVTATNESVDLKGITFTITGQNSGQQVNEISRLYLFDGTTEVASLVPTTTGTTANSHFTLNDSAFRVPLGSNGKKLTLKADLQPIQTGSPATSGRGFQASVSADAYQFKGVASGTNFGTSSTAGSFTGSKFYMFKSLPKVTPQNIASTALVNANGLEFYRFLLTADSSGDVGLYKSSFDVATSTATVASFKFREYNADGSSGEVDLTANSARSVDERITNATYRLNVLFDTNTADGDGVGTGGEYRSIAAGASKVYKLTGDVSGTSSGSSVSTSLVGDGNFPATYPQAASGVDGDVYDAFIWSDLNFGNNSTTATVTIEWVNGYLVFSTSTSQTMSR